MRLPFAAMLLLGSGLLACQHGESSEPVMTPAAGTSVSGVELASEELTSARCDRELRCDHLGPEKRYTSHGDCMRALWSEAYAELEVCEDGVDRNELGECLTDIGDTKCHDKQASIDNWPACQRESLCD
jgi:hypothetical protein